MLVAVVAAGAVGATPNTNGLLAAGAEVVAPNVNGVVPVGVEVPTAPGAGALNVNPVLAGFASPFAGGGVAGGAPNENMLGVFDAPSFGASVVLEVVVGVVVVAAG